MYLEEIVNIIINGLNNIDASYYRMLTTYEPLGIVRERAFCYELYHQIRTVQDKMYDGNLLTLNGEIDKRGHVHFDKNDRKNPDFVFHVPGEFERNAIVVEVKGKLYNVLKDIETLFIFTQKYNYRVGIFLIYNHNHKELLDYIKKRKRNFDRYKTNRILLISKKSVDTRVEILELQQALESI